MPKGSEDNSLQVYTAGRQQGWDLNPGMQTNSPCCVRAVHGADGGGLCQSQDVWRAREPREAVLGGNTLRPHAPGLFFSQPSHGYANVAQP